MWGKFVIEMSVGRVQYSGFGVAKAYADALELIKNPTVILNNTSRVIGFAVEDEEDSNDD